MNASTVTTEALLYKFRVDFTDIKEFGVSLSGLMAGDIPAPAEGARFDVVFSGSIAGPKINGKISGIDYVHVRADGRFQLNIHADIVTDDGARIALHADGVAIPKEGSPVVELRENHALTTSFEEYTWLNRIQIWAKGIADLEGQFVEISAYSA
jgi:hypothetical protein